MLNYFAWEKDPPCIPNPGYCGSLIGSSGKRQRSSLFASLSMPFSPVSGSELQGILLNQERQCWCVFSHLLSSLPSLGVLPLKWDLGGGEGGVLNPRPESRMPLCRVTNSASPIHFSFSLSPGYLFWKDYDCKKELPYVCKFKG